MLRSVVQINMIKKKCEWTMKIYVRTTEKQQINKK